MLIKTEHAETVCETVIDEQAYGKKTTDEPSIYAHPYAPRDNTGGNFCGHYPNAPRFILHNNPYQTGSETDDLGDKRRSSILYKICEKLKAYYDDPSSIPPFNSANRDQRRSDRQRSSARREAMIALSTVMVMNMDLVSLRVGYPSSEGFICRSLEWLAAKAKLSLSRAKRAMSDLLDSGALSSYQYRELLDAERKEYRFHIAVRTFDQAFFQVLNIPLKALNEARDYADKKLDLKAQKQGLDRRLLATVKLRLNQIANRNKRVIPSAKGKILNEEQMLEQTQQAQRFAKRRTEIVVEILSQQPELKNDEAALREAIDKQLRAEGLNYEIAI